MSASAPPPPPPAALPSLNLVIAPDFRMSSVRKRALVTGGAGFLGSHLCERLVARRDDVFCVDNYFTGRKDNISGLLGVSHFEAMRHDITHPLFVEADEIYN